MKFICDRDVIIKAMSISQEIISSKNILSILSNVSIETEDSSIKIKATDLKIGFETSVPVDVVVQGTVTIYCDKFLGIIKSLPSGEIEFELKDNMIFTMRPLFKKINFKLKSFNADKFPELPEIGDAEFFEFPQKDLVEMVSNTIFAISDDETRYFMNGVYLEKKGDQFVMVASDGRRLSCAKRTNSEPKDDINGKIIPPKILNILKKLLPCEGNVKIAIGEKNIFFKFGVYKFSSNLIEGKFPNYQKVIPETQEFRIILKKKELEEAVKRISLVVEQKSRRIYMTVDQNSSEIFSDESDLGMAKEEMNCVYEGPKATIAFNYNYLLDPIRELKEEEVAIEFTNPEKTITVRSVPDNASVHIIMPMQKQKKDE